MTGELLSRACGRGGDRRSHAGHGVSLGLSEQKRVSREEKADTADDHSIRRVVSSSSVLRRRFYIESEGKNWGNSYL